MPNVPVPGDMEGFGVVLLEANLAGTPVIASDLEGIRDVVSNGINGWRIPPLNAQGFAAAVEDVLQSDLDALSKRASDHVAATFSWESVTRQYVRFLNDVMKSRMHEGWKIPYVPA
jgi:phosphatidylinositol alpha-1,6-mannosyltransferase